MIYRIEDGIPGICLVILLILSKCISLMPSLTVGLLTRAT
jgi:hypothetical protein